MKCLPVTLPTCRNWLQLENWYLRAFDGKEGWRGLFIFAVSNIDEARELTATDPVIIKGEMVAEYHAWYGSAGVMEIPAIHARLVQSTKP